MDNIQVDVSEKVLAELKERSKDIVMVETSVDHSAAVKAAKTAKLWVEKLDRCSVA